MRERTSKPINEGTLGRFGRALDSVIFAVAPGWGERRMVSRVRRQLVDKQLSRIGERFGHPSMHPSPSRDRRFVGTRQSTDEMLAEDHAAMQYRSREMVQANPHAAGAIDARVAHEIGVGLSCRPEIVAGNGISEQVARDANARLKDICRQWSEYGVDRQRQFSLAAMQRITQRVYASYGEAFILLREAPFQGPIGLTYELVTPTRCETPPEFLNDENVQLGIRYRDGSDDIAGYYFRKIDRRHRSRFAAEYEFVPRYDSQGLQRCCHVFEPTFSDQSRGIPWLMAAIPFLKDLDDFHEAELIGKQVEACFGLIIKGGKNAVSPMEAAEGNATDVDAAGNRLEEIYPGGVQYMDEDGEITTVDPSRPGGNFAPFVEKSLRTAAAACGLPYEVMAKDFFRTTYSSGQLAMQDGKLGFDMRMQPTIDMAMRPLWRQLVSHAFFHGQMEGLGSRVSYLANRMIWERHNWGGDEFGAIDPMKQKKANEIGLATNQDTLAAISAAKNKDWRDVLRQRDDEKRYETELRIEREKRERELREAAGLPMPEDADDPAAADEAIEDGDEADNRELAESNS